MQIRLDGDVLTVEGKRDAAQKKEGEEWMETNEIFRSLKCLTTNLRLSSENSASFLLSGVRSVVNRKY